MPRTEIWSIASPLKLVEYAAAGLHVVGIDHEGHRWEGQEDWLHLIEGGRGWIERAARTIMMLHRGGLERSKQAQAAAATNLGRIGSTHARRHGIGLRPPRTHGSDSVLIET